MLPSTGAAVKIHRGVGVRKVPTVGVVYLQYGVRMLEAHYYYFLPVFCSPIISYIFHRKTTMLISL
jgi:hypothetical protein